MSTFGPMTKGEEEVAVKLSRLGLGRSSETNLIPSTNEQLVTLLVAEEQVMMEIMENRCRLDDQQLLELIGRYRSFSPEEDQNKFMTRLRRYFNSVTTSKGFQCYHFPGHILDLTPVEPKYKIIYYPDYNESNNHIRHMAKFALDSYNTASGTKFEIKELHNVNKWSTRKIYYITFVGQEPFSEEDFSRNVEEYDGGKQLTFQAKVHDRTDIFYSQPVLEPLGMFLLLQIDVVSDDYEGDVDVEDSDEDDPDETDEDEDSDDEDEKVDPVDIFWDDGSRITDADLLKLMIGDRRSLEEKERFLPKLQRYLKTNWASEGFECDNFPGHVRTLTSWQPRRIVLDRRSKYPEGYSHIMYLASLAIISYNKTYGTKFIAISIDKVNVSKSGCLEYAITFAAKQFGTQDEVTFQAKVLDNTRDIQHSVISCRPKPN